MKIGGLLKTSLIDYPGLISAVIFTQGCNFRCPYCHNPELVDPAQYTDGIEVDLILDFLHKRKGLLDGVVISGGEPTIHEELPLLIRKIKEMGYLVKLDTNGTNPEIISKLIDQKLIDFCAMDFKAPLERYHIATGSIIDQSNLLRTIEILGKAEIKVEFRTTVITPLHSEEDVIKITKMIPKGKKFILQRFEPNKTLDKYYKSQKTLSESTIARLEEHLKQNTINYAIR